MWSTSLRVAIVGTRFNLQDDPLLYSRVNEDVYAFVKNLAEDTLVISGGARGVDTWATDAAAFYGRTWLAIPADWRPNGVVDRAAGFKRNSQIVEEADAVVAFWDGKSNGTRDTVNKAHRANKLLMVYRYWPKETGGLL